MQVTHVTVVVPPSLRQYAAGERRLQVECAAEPATLGGVGTATVPINVLDVTPTVTMPANVTLNEGDTLTATGSFTDPGTNIWTATVDYGDGSGVQPLTRH